MKIGELADTCGVTTKTVRYYESIGLIPEPERTSSGYRSYPDESSDRLHFIKDAQATGLSLTEIASVLELKDVGASTCEHTRSLVERHLAELDEQIARLQTARHELASLAARARTLDPARCTDPTRCQVIAEPKPGKTVSSSSPRVPRMPSALAEDRVAEDRVAEKPVPAEILEISP